MDGISPVAILRARKILTIVNGPARLKFPCTEGKGSATWLAKLWLCCILQAERKGINFPW
jgi:hypothetical protein